MDKGRVYSERDLTASDGVIAKNLPIGFTWFRMADVGGIKRNSCGFDGLLLFGKRTAFFTEVKIKNGKLKESEQKMFKWCKEHNRAYLLLKYYPDLDVWYMEDLTGNGIWSGKLQEVVENLVDYI